MPVFSGFYMATKSEKNGAAENQKTIPVFCKEMGISISQFYLLRRSPNSPKGKNAVEWANFFAGLALEKTTRSVENQEGSRADDVTRFRKLRLAYLDAQAAKERAVQKLKEFELKRRTSELVPLADARKLIVENLESLSALLESLPAAAASLANPSNPAIAETAIRIQVEKIKRAMSQ